MENMENTKALGDIIEEENITKLMLCLYEHYRLLKLGYFHGDLHLYNALFERNTNYIKKQEVQGRVTLIDFGKTYKYDEIPNWQISNDFMYNIFFKKLFGDARFSLKLTISFYDILIELIESSLGQGNYFFDKNKRNIVNKWIIDNNYIIINKISNELQKEIKDIFKLNSNSSEWKNKYIDMFKDVDSFNANFVLKNDDIKNNNDMNQGILNVGMVGVIIEAYKTFWIKNIEKMLGRVIAFQRTQFRDRLLLYDLFQTENLNFKQGIEIDRRKGITLFQLFIYILENSNHDTENWIVEIFSRHNDYNDYNNYANQFNQIINGRNGMITEVRTKMAEHGIDTNINAYLTYYETQYGGAVGTLNPMSTHDKLLGLNKAESMINQPDKLLNFKKEESMINQVDKLSNFNNVVFTDAYFEDVKTELTKMNTTIPKLYEKEEEIHKQLLSDITNNH